MIPLDSRITCMYNKYCYLVLLISIIKEVGIWIASMYSNSKRARWK